MKGTPRSEGRHWEQQTTYRSKVRDVLFTVTQQQRLHTQDEGTAVNVGHTTACVQNQTYFGWLIADFSGELLTAGEGTTTSPKVFTSEHKLPLHEEYDARKRDRAAAS